MRNNVFVIVAMAAAVLFYALINQSLADINYHSLYLFLVSHYY